MANNKYEFDKSKSYKIDDALEIVKKNSKTKFDSSIDIAIKLNLDTSKAEQQLRGTISLPNFFGKKSIIAVIDENLTDKDAKLLNVEYAGGKELIDKIATGWMEFDLIIVTPKMMPQLSRLGKVLGPRGLMPNPKIGNVTTDLKKTIFEFQKGVSQYRTDSYGNIHMLVGKVSSDLKKVQENIEFLINFIKTKRPSTVKGIYIQSMFISSTMGPGIKLENN